MEHCMTIPRPLAFVILGLALAGLCACKADVKIRTVRLSAPEPTFEGQMREWQPYVPQPDDRCLAVQVDKIDGPYDRLPQNGTPAKCTARLIIPYGDIPKHPKINVVELKFEQGDRICFLMKRSQSLILVFGPDGNLRSVEDHYPPVPVKITE